MRSPSPLTITPPLALLVATGMSLPSIVLNVTAPPAPVGPAMNWLAADVSLMTAAIATLLPDVVAVMSTMPTVLPVTVLIEPAAFKLSHADPDHAYRLLSSVSRASWPVNAPEEGNVVTKSTVDSSASLAAVTASSASFAVVIAESATAAVATSPALKRIFAPGIVSSLINVTPLATRSPTVSFLVSLALLSTTATKSPVARAEPASALS